MDKRYYLLYQLLGWSTIGFILIVSIYLRPFFDWTEVVFASVLVGSAGVFSHVTRKLFSKGVQSQSVALQFLYFAFMSLAGALVASGMLVLVFYVFAQGGVIDPVPPGKWGFIIRHITVGNSFNMFGALLLWSAFYITIIKVRQLRDTSEALASSQLEALSQQLNPHFLFNMLNNIRALILEDPARARDALARLADMLRYSLQQGNHSQQHAKVTLAEELLIAEEYVALCKIQFEQRLSYHVEVTEEAKAALVPRLLIQLCIENAIKHGIGLLREGGTIQLTAGIKAGRLHISLTNPCPLIEKVNVQEQSTGIGLRNIRDRLKLLYGDKLTQLDFSKAKHTDFGQATITLVIPFEMEQE